MTDNNGFRPGRPDDVYDASAFDRVADEPRAGAAPPDGASPDPAGVRSGDTMKFIEFNLKPNGMKELNQTPAQRGDNRLNIPQADTSEFLKQDNRDTGREDFDVDFDFEGEYRDAPSARPLRVRREKRTGCIGGLLYAAFIICVSLVLAVLLWMAATDVLALGKKESEITVTIPNEATTEDVSEILNEKGLIKYKRLFQLYCKFSDSAKEIAGGTYNLNTNYDYRALVIGLIPGTGKRVEIDVTIPEGFTLIQIFDLLEEKGVCSKEELWDTAANYEFDYEFLDSATLGEKYRLEGYLFPDTYTFYVDDSATHVIGKLLSNFKNKFTAEYIDRASELGYSMRDVLKIASMIEREAAYDSERDAIASVIYNRLNSSNFSCLQIDATIYYGIAINGDDKSAFSTEYESEYNSYLYEGLPPGPICNPGIQSIRGALYPQDTSYYYYALSVNGGHEFFTNYDAFLDFINSEEYSPS